MCILFEMDFSRIHFLSVLSYLIVWQSFAQSPEAALIRKDPLQDSVEKYQNRKEFEKVLPFAEQWVEELKQAKMEASPEYGFAHHVWGTALNQIGKRKEAEPVLLKGLEIRKRTLGENHPDVGASLNTLGGFYMDLGNYPKAEPYHLQALEVRRKVFGENHLQVAASLNSLGGLYMELGSYTKAEGYYLQALEIRKRAYGENHPNVAASLNSLGGVHIGLRNYPKAESHLLQALEIRKKTLGENHPDFVKSLNNLGILNYNIDNYTKAESYYLQSLEIKKNILGENNPVFARSLSNLAILYMEMGNFPKAESFRIQALDIFRKALGESHPEVSLAISYLGNSYFSMGKMAKAESLYLEWNTKKQEQIQRYFPFLSDQEKTSFYESNLSVPHDEFLSFCVGRYPGNKAIIGNLYNDQLATKGLLLNSSAKWKHRIKTAGDKKLNRKYDEWETSQNTLNKLLHSTDSTERAGIDSVERKTEKMEKELSLRSENFAKLADKKLITWKEVQKTLKPGEVAIEMVRVQKFGIARIVTDTNNPKKPVYKVKGLTDTIYYAALIVKPESVYPEMVLLKNGNELEQKALKFYQNSIFKQIPDNQSYGKFWEKIGTKLGTSTRVYFSPDGVFHNINLNTLYNPITKKYLLEEKEVRMVTVTKDLVNPSMAEEENKLAELVGFPNFYTAGSTAGVATTDWKSQETSFGFRLESMGELVELPGTKGEVDRIADVLAAKGWEVKNYTQEKALEANIKESYKPRVLHIATHGFFQPDSTKGSNPLLRSGLMLAGAGSTLKGEKNEGEDGILTAYEAMNLNLDNTDLVVLSACETGLGEVKNGEGVYGLQRAFKVAGAKTIIMSLWKVNDAATQELMVSFYKNWLADAVGAGRQKASGTGLTKGADRITKRSAFLKAQKELKAKYPNPYYWGAFVMVGD